MAYNGAGTVYPATATRDTFFIGTNEGTTDSLAQVTPDAGGHVHRECPA
ncbi:hypothetical protein JKA73_26425 [Myxococcus xanthus]|nr:hypothetical protein [Myxococcus xanthus]QQR42607.1 hypothetical protein JKA73_26425 [Myxococcus xanthus]